MDEQNYSPIKCTFLYSKKENVRQWEYDLNSALVTADIWHLKSFAYSVSKGTSPESSGLLTS
jgi:hypothetical protein